MANEPRERIIFDDDNYYDTDIAVEDLMERDDLTEDEVRAEYSDSELFDRAMDMRDVDFEEEVDALKSYLDGRPSDMSNTSSEHGGNPIMVHGSIGRWNGTSVGTSFFNNLDDVLYGSDSPFKDCEIEKVWDENGHLYIHGAHHDGSVTVELRQLSDDGTDAKEAIEDAWVGEPFEANGKTYDGSDQSLNDAIRDLWESTDPPRYMERAFGCPAEEWDEPEQETGEHELGDEEVAADKESAYDATIPERLQLLRVGLGGADDLGVFAYYIDTQQTNWSVPSFCLGPADGNPEFMDVQGTIEETLHNLLDNGGTPDDVRRIMGLVQESELDGDALKSDAYTPIDLGWCIEGNILDFKRIPPESSDVHAILSDAQIERIAQLPSEDFLNQAEKIAHGEEPDKGSSIDRPLDLQTGKWRVHLVYEGDHYGRTGSLTYGDAKGDAYPYIGQRINDCQLYGHGLPLVEFYDTSANPLEFPDGQFVSRYYMSTLLGMDTYGKDIADYKGFSLDGSVPAWTIRGDDFRAVSDYLHEARDACVASSTHEQESLESDIDRMGDQSPEARGEASRGSIDYGLEI